MAIRRDSENVRRGQAGGDDLGRRALAAFALGAAISLAGLAALVANPSLAHGPYIPANPIGAAIQDWTAPSFAPVARDDGDKPRRERITIIAGGAERHASHSHAGRASYAGGQPVCVRLCDGYFFPLSTGAGDVGAQGAACDRLCPDAPTEVYYRNGADGIEGAVSAHGRPYAALPVSLRYRGVSDNTCACHRNPIAYAPLRDPTLKRGDAVMTPAGFMVFRGAEAASHGPGDFIALGGAGLPAQSRGALQEMERASLTPTHPTLKDWLVSQAHPAPQLAARAPTPSERGPDKIRLLVWDGARD
jgi:hypothetical protein